MLEESKIKIQEEVNEIAKNEQTSNEDKIKEMMEEYYNNLFMDENQSPAFFPGY